MKKTALLLASLMIFAGCAQNSQTVDEQYIDSLKKSLETRWESETLEPGYGNGEFPVAAEKFADAIDEQIKELEPYTKETFENPELQKEAETYYSSLEELKDIKKYLTADPSRFYTKYEEIQERNDVILSDINRIVPLEFADEESQVKMEKILDESRLAEAVKKMIADIRYETVEEFDEGDYYYTELQGTIKNTTGFSFDYLDIDFRFIDENGETVGEDYRSFSSFRPDQEQNFELSADQKYSKIEVTRVNCMVQDIGYSGNIYISD